MKWFKLLWFVGAMCGAHATYVDLNNNNYVSALTYLILTSLNVYGLLFFKLPEAKSNE